MKKIFCLLFTAFSLLAYSQPATEKARILYGSCTKDSLTVAPFSQWFNTGYESYHPGAAEVAGLKKMTGPDITIKIFFGTWCGDSKRELPRFLKLLSSISFPEKQYQLIAVGGSDSLVKQSPQHEEAGLGVFRVPVFIIYKNGKELNRINEFPVQSLEKDLLAILGNRSYQPNYHSFSAVLSWMNDGTLLDENISIRGLAEQLRFRVANEHELNSLGYLLLKQGNRKEALQLFRINYSLYPESSNTASSLGEGYLENNEYTKAVTALERSLELNKEPGAVKEILALLYKAKEKG